MPSTAFGTTAPSVALPLTRLAHSPTASDQPRRRVFFLHVPKTGGTALTQQLALLFRESRIQPWGARLPDLANKYAGRPSALGRARIWDHHDAQDFDLFSRDHLCLSDWLSLVQAIPELNTCICFTVLREPVARSFSMLHHIRRRTVETIQAAYSAGMLTAEDRDNALTFQRLACELPTLELLNQQQPELRAIVERELANCATHMLSTAPKEATDQEHLESAKKNLCSLDIVGLQEDLAGTFQQLCMKLDVPMPPLVIDANVGDYQRSIDEAVRARLTAMNSLDIELYQLACQLHREKMNALPGADAYNADWARRQPPTGCRDDYGVCMSEPILGWGWHCREGGVGDIPYLCWTTGTSVIYLPMIVNQSYELSIRCRGSMSDENWTKSSVLLAGNRFPLHVVPAEDGLPILKTELQCTDGVSGWQRVDIVPFETRSHQQLDAACPDTRQKGICVEQITLRKTYQ